MVSVRELVFGFFNLSYPDRMRILLDLKLLDDTDTGISDSDLLKRAIARAQERGQLAQLADAIISSPAKE